MRIVKSAYFCLHEILPKSIRDKLADSWTHSSVRRTLRKRRVAKLKALKSNALRTFGKFGADEMACIIRDLGIMEGDCLFVQCSFDNLHTLDASPIELIRVIEGVIGPTGTLLMPAYTSRRCPPSQPFKPLSDATYTGIVSEIFRRSNGVIRSLHPRHSICGRGPLAAQLLDNHELCSRADGPNSPFDRMRRLHNAKILTLGLPLGHISFLHWVEDFEPDKLPFVVFRSAPVTSTIEELDGNVITIQDWHVRSDVAARLDLVRLFSQLTEGACRFAQHKGISIGTYSMMPLAAELLALRDRGIIHYY